MNFIVKQTLKNIVLVKIAVLLWSQQDVRVLLTEFTHSDLFSRLYDELKFTPFIISGRRNKWLRIEDQVIKKIAKLTLPTCLKEKMLVYIQSVGHQIMKWMEYHLKHCCLDLNLPNEFCWTSQAVIDRKKTAEMLMSDASINITTRYKLACIYCLEENIPKLWKELPECKKNISYNEEDSHEILQTELLIFWGYYIKGNIAMMDDMFTRLRNYRSFYSYYLCRSAAESGNKAATDYFFQKLSPRGQPLVNIALSVIEKSCNKIPEITQPPKEYYTEVLCFLFSHMSKDQQMEVFKTHPAEVLCCFLNWPWQSFFLEIAGLLWNFLPLRDYQFVLQSILSKLVFGYMDYNYNETFRDIWQQISDDGKNYIINNGLGIFRVLEMLLYVKDEENLKLIFQSTNFIDKHKLIFSDEGLYLCKIMIDYDKWDLLKFFVQLLISSKDEMIKFKKEFEKHVETNKRKIHKNKYEKLFPLLDDLVCGYNKRENIEAGSSSAKRLCNIEFKDVTRGANK